MTRLRDMYNLAVDGQIVYGMFEEVHGRSATCRAGDFGRKKAKRASYVWHYTYVLEKLGQSEQTTYAVAGIVNAALGIDAAYAVECMERVKGCVRSKWGASC